MKRGLQASLTLVAAVLLAQAACRPGPSMRGVPGVHIQVVLEADQEAEETGLASDALSNLLEQDVKNQLAAAGIRVLTEEESRETPGWPTLFIQVNVMAVRTLPPRPDTVGVLTGAHSYRMDVEFRQWVVPEESLDSKPVMIPTTSWAVRSAAPLWRLSDATQMVRDALQGAVGQFVQDWQEANSG